MNSLDTTFRLSASPWVSGTCTQDTKPARNVKFPRTCFFSRHPPSRHLHTFPATTLGVRVVVTSHGGTSPDVTSGTSVEFVMITLYFWSELRLILFVTQRHPNPRLANKIYFTFLLFLNLYRTRIASLVTFLDLIPKGLNYKYFTFTGSCPTPPTVGPERLRTAIWCSEIISGKSTMPLPKTKLPKHGSKIVTRTDARWKVDVEVELGAVAEFAGGVFSVVSCRFVAGFFVRSGDVPRTPVVMAHLIIIIMTACERWPWKLPVLTAPAQCFSMCQPWHRETSAGWGFTAMKSLQNRDEVPMVEACGSVQIAEGGECHVGAFPCNE